MVGRILRGWFGLGLLLVLSGALQAGTALTFRGQASGWANVNPGQEFSLWLGMRYLPQIHFQTLFGETRLLDFELSANIHGSGGAKDFSAWKTERAVKPYRAWARFAAPQLELRLGLQKINFGSAALLRPLMWFDQVDPRDPLQLTDGVWGLMGRYTFLNNANIWLWGLYGNEGPKTWEIGETAVRIPEFGGRAQVPVPRGEAALSFHRRTADLSSNGYSASEPLRMPENRYGFDAKIDVGVGLWLEGTWINKRGEAGPFANQQIWNLGLDYTFGLGNGLHAIGEQLLFSYDREPFAFGNATHFSAVSLSYPLNILDSLGAILYRDWTHKNTYAFINWKRQYDRIAFYLMAFWNPEVFQLPQQSEGARMFAGKGFQVMVVFNH